LNSVNAKIARKAGVSRTRSKSISTFWLGLGWLTHCLDDLAQILGSSPFQQTIEEADVTGNFAHVTVVSSTNIQHDISTLGMLFTCEYIAALRDGGYIVSSDAEYIGKSRRPEAFPAANRR
jgi:hypothetical protein